MQNEELTHMLGLKHMEVVYHDDVQMATFSEYWPFVPGIHWPPVNSSHKGQWHGALMFSLICVWINTCVNNRKAGDLRCHWAHYDLIVMSTIYGFNFKIVKNELSNVIFSGSSLNNYNHYHHYQYNYYHWISLSFWWLCACNTAVSPLLTYWNFFFVL